MSPRLVYHQFIFSIHFRCQARSYATLYRVATVENIKEDCYSKINQYTMLILLTAAWENILPEIFYFHLHLSYPRRIKRNISIKRVWPKTSFWNRFRVVVQNTNFFLYICLLLPPNFPWRILSHAGEHSLVTEWI